MDSSPECSLDTPAGSPVGITNLFALDNLTLAAVTELQQPQIPPDDQWIGLFEEDNSLNKDQSPGAIFDTDSFCDLFNDRSPSGSCPPNSGRSPTGSCRTKDIPCRQPCLSAANIA